MDLTDNEIIQVNITGYDKPGLTTALTDILAKYDAFILDIGQANIHQTLTMGILFSTERDKSGFIMKDLLFKASELGVMIRFTPIEREAYDAWVARQGKHRYIVTLLGRQVTARQIADVTNVIFQFGLNIDAIRRLTGRPPLEPQDDNATKACIESAVRGSLGHDGRAAMQDALKSASLVPLNTAKTAAEVFPLAEAAVKSGNRNAVTDGLVAAMMARTAVLGALLNVKINLGSIKDEAFVQELQAACGALQEEAIAAEQRILDLVPELK